jgi:flagellar basal body P-ring protein FlgI
LSYSNGVATYSDSITLGSIADAKDITKPTLYINPTKKFDGAVLKDAAGNIIGLHFTLNN